MGDALDDLRTRAIDGDKHALEELVGSLVDDVHQISVRMMWDPLEAEDATQEILTKVVTKLASFEGRSSLKTWVYRIAVNHLLDRRRRPHESLTFDVLAADLLDGLADPDPAYQPELEVLAHDIKVACTGAMLLCLDRPHRVAYLLGEILELPGPMAAEITDIDAATFRKRLQRARSDIRGFMETNCGLVSTKPACQCTRRINRAVELGRVHVNPRANSDQASKAVEEIGTIQRAEIIMRSTLGSAPDKVANEWKAILDASPTLMGEQ